MIEKCLKCGSTSLAKYYTVDMVVYQAGGRVIAEREMDSHLELVSCTECDWTDADEEG